MTLIPSADSSWHILDCGFLFLFPSVDIISSAFPLLEGSQMLLTFFGNFVMVLFFFFFFLYSSISISVRSGERPG